MLDHQLLEAHFPAEGFWIGTVSVSRTFTSVNLKDTAVTTLFAYEITPVSNPDKLFFAATLDECRLAARQQRSELRADPDYGTVEPMPLYEVDMEIPDIQILLHGLNHRDDLTNAIIIDRKLIEIVDD